METEVLGHTSKTRRLIISPHLSTGGLPQYLVWYVERLLERDEEVWVLEWSNIAPVYKVQKDRLRELLGDRLIVWAQGIDNDEKQYLLKQLIFSIDPSIIHLAEFPESFIPQQITEFLYEKGREFTLVETTHDSKFLVAQKQLRPDKFIFVTPFHMSIFSGFGVEMELEEYRLKEKNRLNREEKLRGLGLDPGKKHVLNVGLFAPGKNQAEVFELARRIPEVEFQFVGNQAQNFQSYWEPLMQNKPSNCTIWGERNDVDTFYSCMDLLLFPSKHELLPLVPIEALSWQMPVMMRKLDIYGERFEGEVEWIDEDMFKTEYKIRKELGVEKKLKIKLVHLLTRPNNLREVKSVESLSKLQDYGVEYVQHINEPCKEYPENLPALQTHQFKKPGYYGAYQAFRRAFEEEFNSEVDLFLVCECDCVLDVSKLEFMQTLIKVSKEEFDFFSFGYNTWSDKIAPLGELGFLTNKIIAAHCIMFPQSSREFLLNELKSLPWDSPDLWLDYCFRDRVKGVLNKSIASQHEGFSLIDNVERVGGLRVGEKEAKKDNFAVIDGTEVEIFVDKPFSLGFYREIFDDLVYESGVCKVTPGDVCVDLGGNLGLFDLFALSRGASKVVTVEATDGEVLEVLHKNLDRFGNKVEIVNKAVSKENGEVVFYKYADIGMSTIDPSMLDRYGKFKESLTVECITLEALCTQVGIDKIDFLKIDIEGGEYEVVLNTEKTFLLDRVKKLAIEYHPHPEYELEQLRSYLKDCGFVTWLKETSSEFGMLYGVSKKGLQINHDVRLSHTLCLPDTPREIASVESLVQLKDFGVEYIKYVNPPTKQFPLGLETVREFTSRRKIPGHYGCYTSFKQAFLDWCDSEKEFLLFCEGDCLLDVDPVEFIGEVTNCCELMIDGELDCATLGHLDWSVPSKDLANGFRVIDKFMNAQCVLFSSSCKDILRHELLTGPWDVTDQWLEFYLNKHNLIQGMPSKQLTSQGVGMSLLESWVSPQRRRGENFACKYSDEGGFARVSFKSDNKMLDGKVLTVVLEELDAGKELHKIEGKFKFLEQHWIQSGIISEYLQGVRLRILNKGEEVFKFEKSFAVEDVEESNSESIFQGKVECSFVGKPKVSVSGNAAPYHVEFWRDDKLMYQTDLGSNHWGSVNVEYYCDWIIKVEDKYGNLIEHKFDAKNKRVFIAFGSKALGDTLAWFPYVEEFQKKHQCRVSVSTCWNDLFVDEYPELEFVKPGSTVSDLYAMFTVGCFDDDSSKHKINWRLVALQKVASDILGLDYRELKPRISKPKLPRSHKNEYVAISQFASNVKAKRWNRPDGWKDLVDKIKSLGLDVMAVSQEQTDLLKVRRCTNKPIEETIRNICYSKAFIGMGSGLAWLAWSLGKPVVLISGFSEKFCEMLEGEKVSRIINEEVCHGCFNDIEYVFDRGDSEWCPRNENYVCTKEISVDSVFSGLKRVLE